MTEMCLEFELSVSQKIIQSLPEKITVYKVLTKKMFSSYKGQLYKFGENTPDCKDINRLGGNEGLSFLFGGVLHCYLSEEEAKKGNGCCVFKCEVDKIDVVATNGKEIAVKKLNLLGAV